MNKNEDLDRRRRPSCSWRWPPSSLAGAVVPGGTPQATAADPVVLTVTGNGQTKTFTMAELQALPAYSGYSGIINSAGTVTPPSPVKGVKLTDLMAEVGGIPELQSTDVTASDDYGMTLTYDEVVNGNIVMYNATTKQEEAAKAPVSVVLALRRERRADPARPERRRPAASRRVPAHRRRTRSRPGTST